MIAPPARPLSAEGTLVSTLNSAIASGGGKMSICPNCDSLLSTPSNVKLLFVTRAPFADTTEPPDSRKRVDSVDEPGAPGPERLPPPNTPTLVDPGRVTPGT